jgi:hypothetical protein
MGAYEFNLLVPTDFNGDGKPDILWRNPSKGWNAVWYMNGIMRIGSDFSPELTDPNWIIVGR